MKITAAASGKAAPVPLELDCRHCVICRLAK
jgi:hypothetical protein